MFYTLCKHLLSVRRVHTTFASRGFIGTIWNSLPSDIRLPLPIISVAILKVCCFQQAFGSPYWLTHLPQIRPLADIVQD